ncbi:MAG: SpoIIE family protein phosphatase [candidate division KSB1 bacterium]|nr:SpoIIE family protein phosphatase [candidate division KSB1 bacterium]MDZ7335594.1 SpoIIE family protein phosphatase [candidate division KSB1 bacterium]
MFKVAIHEEIKVPALFDHLGDLRNFVTKAGRKHDFPSKVINHLKLCVDEAATNIIKHAYRDYDGVGMITLRVIVKKNSMTVVLIDQGKYFDPQRVEDPDLKRYVQIGKKGGLGIFMMRKMIDEIDYQHTEEGNELRMTVYRDGGLKKKAADKRAATTLSFSLKTRYSMITGAVLTAVVTLGYLVFFFIHGNKVFNDFVKTQKFATEELARLLMRASEKLDPYNSTPIINEYIKERKEIFRIILVDETDRLLYTTDENLFSMYFNSEFKISHSKERYGDYLFLYEAENNQKLYSFVRPILDNDNNQLGKVYLEIGRDQIRKKITAQRLKDLQVALLILLIGYAGIIVLIYFILNPFRKLAAWVKDLGSGNVKDEIDFDQSSEVGQLAAAFSEMTDKVRESQKNLAEQQRIKTEMQVGQEIQQRLIPREIPQIEGYEIAPYYEAAKELGGDYFDFIEVDKDTLGIVVADVSGKGVPGSLVMAYIKATLRTEARSIKSASEVLTRVNEIVVDDMKKGMFVTLFYIIIDSKKRRINYASAGHNPMILYRKSTNKTYYLNPHGFPVGIALPDPDLFKKSIESDTIQLTEDDILLLYTDGITEAMNRRRELFGEERLLDCIRNYGHLSVDEFIKKLRDEIHSFTEGYEQSDDITVVAIKEKSTPEKIELNRARTAHQLVLQGKSIREACETAGITTYAYYNKYKKIFEEEGLDAYSIDDSVSVEAKHLSIEEKTKIYDIIRKHPEYGAKRISEVLDTEEYGFTKINESRIYDELVRSRLNTRQLREAYIARAGKRKRLKPPGTPMLTLDGRVILRKDLDNLDLPTSKPAPKYEYQPKTKPERAIPKPERQEATLAPQEPDDKFVLESMVTLPIEDLLEKRKPADDRSKTKPPAAVEAQSVEPSPEQPLPEQKVAEKTEQQIPEQPIEHRRPEDIEIEAELGLDELLSEKETPPDESVELESELSFRDIWDEQAEEATPSEVSLEAEPNLAPTQEPTDSGESRDIAKDERGEVEQTSIAPDEVDLDELLGDSTELKEDEKELGFDSITDHVSFKDLIFGSEDDNDGNLLNEDASMDKKATETSPAVSDAAAKPEDESNESSEDIQPLKIVTIDENELLEDEPNEAITEFTFDDLIDEIESELSFFDEAKTEEPELEPVYHDADAIAVAKKASKDEKLAVVDREAEKKNSPQASATAVSPERLREKYLALGIKYYQEQKYEQAVEQFLKVIELDPDFKEAHSILGNAYYRVNKVDLAIKSYQRVKEIDPFDVDAYENTGVVYANMGRYRDAIREWKTALKYNPNREDIMRYIEKAEALLIKNERT